MAQVRCTIHDEVFNTNSGAPGSDPNHPFEHGRWGHPDCPKCQRDADGPRYVTKAQAQQYADQNKVELEVATQALAEQGYSVSDDLEVHAEGEKIRAERKARQAKAASVRANTAAGIGRTMAKFNPGTPGKSNSAATIAAEPTISASAPTPPSGPTISRARLQEIADKSGASIEDAQKQAETQGFTVTD